MSWLLLLVALWPLLWLVRVLTVARMLLALEFRRAQLQGVGPDEIPGHMREAAQPLLTHLESLGFLRLGGWAVTHGEVSPLDYEAVVLCSRDGSTRALVRSYPESDRCGDCYVTFRTTTADGRELVTTSYRVEQLVPLPAAVTVEVLENASVMNLLARHAERVAKASAKGLWRCTELPYALEREQLLLDAALETVRHCPDLTTRADGVATYRLIPAIRRSIVLLREADAKRKKAAKPAQSAVSPALSAESRLAFDLRQYREIVALGRGRMSLRNKAILCAVSLLAFAAVLAWNNSPVAAITLLVALVVHEAGHLLGMWWFGFKDTQLLFFPFFGGAAIGHDCKVLRPWQHIVIILLGPMPGIFVALGVLAWRAVAGVPDWVETAAFTTLGLNVFNLAPILPLDGGQILDHAFTARFPRARVIFLGLSAVALVLIGWTIDRVSLITGLGVLMLWQLRSDWRLARVRRSIRAEFPNGADEDTIVRRLLSVFRQPEWAPVPMVLRHKHTQALQRELRGPRPGFGTLLFAAAGYAAPLWLGLPMVLVVVMGAQERRLAAADERARAAGLMSGPIGADAPAAVPESGNAAPLMAQATALYLSRGDDDRTARGAEVVQLLQAAAQRPAFAPTGDDPHLAEPLAFVSGRFTRGLALHALFDAADEKTRSGAGGAAIDLVITAWRLIRLMNTAPGWLPWETHERLTGLCCDRVEAALAAGTVISPAQTQALRELVQDRAEIEYARRALPQSLRDQAGLERRSLLLRVLKAADLLVQGSAGSPVTYLEEAVVVSGQLQGIAEGCWPHVPAGQKDFRESVRVLAALADLIARERQLLAAVQWAELSASAAVTSLSELGLQPAKLRHPLTGEPMRLERRGDLSVLTFASGLAHVYGQEFRARLEWRLPARRSS